jgi:hypothetical protein
LILSKKGAFNASPMPAVKRTIAPSASSLRFTRCILLMADPQSLHFMERKDTAVIELPVHLFQKKAY